ncbi:MAG: hypothetical protein CMM93_08190 [Rickettsiales bacterium]|nr:hypothetical protein [Rickettsiales bacterium]
MANLSLAQTDARPTLSVIICIHNAPDYTEMCIDSVLKFTPQPYDLILVNDGSRAETTAVVQRFVKEYDHIRLVHHTKALGYTRAANAGLRLSKADYAVLLNSDTLVSEGWSEQLIACAESDAKIGVTGPLSNAATYQSVPYVFDDRGRWKQNELAGDITVNSFGKLVADVSAYAYPRVPVINGFCFCIKRSVIDTIGYLDEDTFPRGYGEENDFCLRAADAGYEMAVCDAAYVYHATSQSFGEKARESLTKNAHHAIRSKHTQERLDGIDYALRNHPEMDQVRERIQQALHGLPESTTPASHLPPLATDRSAYATLFLLPGCSAKAGGTQVVVELARALNRLGYPVKIASTRSKRKEYETFFAADANLFVYYEKEAELLQMAQRFQIVVATIFLSVALMKKMLQHKPSLVPMYFVQDYEPFFMDKQPEYKKEAVASYTLIPDCHLFGISHWVKEVIAEKHQKTVHVIAPSFDQELFYPDLARGENPVPVISAMIRPTTPWRGPKRSMRVLKAIKDRFEDQVEIRTFGCPLTEIGGYGLETEFDFYHYEILGRRQVAQLLQASDIFLDLSDFQAFGRTALEAMACGCAVIAPQAGGVNTYATDEKDCLLVDTENEEACIAAACELVEDAMKRHAMAQAGMETGLRYSNHRSALSFIDLVHSLTRVDAEPVVQSASNT